MKYKTKRRRKGDIPRLFDKEFIYYSAILILASIVFIFGLNN